MENEGKKIKISSTYSDVIVCYPKIKKKSLLRFSNFGIFNLHY